MISFLVGRYLYAVAQSTCIKSLKLPADVIFLVKGKPFAPMKLILMDDMNVLSLSIVIVHALYSTVLAFYVQRVTQTEKLS